MLDMLALAAAAKDPPLIDLDSTIFLQLAIYLLTAFVLSRFLFRPFLEVRAAREQGIEGARQEARRMEETATARMADYDARLTKAKVKANEQRAKLRAEAARTEREIADAARKESQGTLDAAHRSLADAARETRAALAPRVEEIARQIAGKILGREVAR